MKVTLEAVYDISTQVLSVDYVNEKGESDSFLYTNVKSLDDVSSRISNFISRRCEVEGRY